MSKLLAKLKPYKYYILLAILFLFVSSILDLSLPNLMSTIVNEGIPSGDTNFILKTGLKMLLISLLIMLCSISSNYLTSKAAMSFGRDLRSDVFNKITNFSLHESDKIGVSSLITRNTNDIIQMQMLVMFMLRTIVSSPLHMIGGVIMAVSKDPTLSLVFVVAVPIMLIIIIFNIRWVTPIFKQIQTKLDRVNRVIRELLSGVRVIRAFNRIDHEKDRFNNANRDLTKTSLTAFRRMAAMQPFTMITINFAILAIFVFGSIRIEGGHMRTGDLMAFIQYATQIMFSLMMASMLFGMLPRAAVSARRISEVLNMESEVKDPENPKSPVEHLKGYVRFENVTFRYPGAEEPVLNDISFEANPGETVAVIGGTGSGKSTLVNLIPRFYEIESGKIYVDGVNIREMTQEELRSKIGYIPQKAILFTGSIADNIRYGKADASDEEIRYAADIAQATTFIDEMEDGFDSYLSQDATNVSGGQKQRISIARAIVKRPEIYIFDDSFSALDFRTDANLRAALKPITKNSTVFIVAQRVSTVMNADRIIVLDNGNMVGYGTHKELLNNCEVYREIVTSQLSEEELA
ncbi:MAG: ABC transporter ATP-binding protein [Eubacteriales bacterium]